MVYVFECYPIYAVKFVISIFSSVKILKLPWLWNLKWTFLVKVKVISIHEHHHLLHLWSWSFGVDNHHSIKPTVDVVLDRFNMAVVWIQSKGCSYKIIDITLAGCNYS